jgi:dihydroorotate dehydrogenase
MIYEKILRPILFKATDPEKIHHLVINGLGMASRCKPAYNLIKKHVATEDARLGVKLGGLSLNTPVGLAAGFDKYIEAPLAYSMLGFGFAELGSITYSEQPGNPKPRLWRIPEDKGIIVYYGLPNNGAKKTAVPLSKLSYHPIPYGISIAPTTGLELTQMADDYIRTFRELHSYGDYFTFNVSCPNVAKNDTFSQVSFMEELTGRVAATMNELAVKKDIFLKIGPHHSDDELKRIVNACIKNGFTGIIATNLIKNRANIKAKSSESALNHPGGISGKLLQSQSDEIIRKLYKESAGKLKIIGVGGVFTAEDAYRKIRLGASAVQLITGFIYGGPLAIKNINEGILKIIERDKLTSISEAIGLDA